MIVLIINFVIFLFETEKLIYFDLKFFKSRRMTILSASLKLLIKSCVRNKELIFKSLKEIIY